MYGLAAAVLTVAMVTIAPRDAVKGSLRVTPVLPMTSIFTSLIFSHVPLLLHLSSAFFSFSLIPLFLFCVLFLPLSVPPLLFLSLHLLSSLFVSPSPLLSLCLSITSPLSTSAFSPSPLSFFLSTPDIMPSGTRELVRSCLLAKAFLPA